MNKPVINKKTCTNHNTIQKKARAHSGKTISTFDNNKRHRNNNTKFFLADKSTKNANFPFVSGKNNPEQRKAENVINNAAKLKTGNTDSNQNTKDDRNKCRLQKALAAAGIGSRRACEAIITANRVQVNGITVNKLGTKIDPYKDKITLDFKLIAKEQYVYIIINKPKGYITSVKDTKGRPTVMSLIYNINERIYPVGRLDFNSEGILLMTNDGALAQKLMSPNSHIAKVYMIKVHRMPKPETLKEFRNGFRLSGIMLKPCLVEIIEPSDNPWLKVTITEGKNQQIRRMFAAVGHPVSKLRRIQFGPLSDPNLKPGMWRLCNTQELNTLKAL